MVNEHKLLRDAERASQAQAILDNALLNESYDAIEAQLISAWRETKARDTEARELIWHAIQANAKHKGYLQSILNDGKLAAAELKQLALATERKQRYGVI